MSSVLGQLSIAMGGIIFLVVLAIGWFNDLPMLESVWRAAIAMCLGAVITAAFFRFFTSILYEFVTTKIKESEAPPPPPPNTKSAPPTTAKPPPRASAGKPGP